MLRPEQRRQPFAALGLGGDGQIGQKGDGAAAAMKGNNLFLAGKPGGSKEKQVDRCHELYFTMNCLDADFFADDIGGGVGTAVF
jgi:hypothetical protein